jgi:hypothetical protein
MFSQAEEDDVLAGLIERLDLAARTPRTFVEIGVGTGLENNTRLLALREWRGWWFGDESAVDVPEHVTFAQVTVTPENVADLLRYVPPRVTVFSLDIDGNDYWVARVAVPLLLPTILIVEYCVDAPYPGWIMPYTPGYRWRAGEPCGASLAAWRALLMPTYTLVYTTRAKVNAVFVRTAVLHNQREEHIVDDTLQAIITELRQLQQDLAKNDGRPSVQELQNRLGRLAIMAEMVQQNLALRPATTAPTPPPPNRPDGQVIAVSGSGVVIPEDDEPAGLGAGAVGGVLPSEPSEA